MKSAPRAWILLPFPPCVWRVFTYLLSGASSPPLCLFFFNSCVRSGKLSESPYGFSRRTFLTLCVLFTREKKKQSAVGSKLSIMSRFHQLFSNNENNFRNGQWQHSWLSPFTSRCTQPHLPQSDRSSCHLSHAALTCTNFDFSSFNHLTCVCGILIGLRSDRENPVRLLSKCHTAVALWPYGLPHSLPVTGYMESQKKSRGVPERLYLDLTVMFRLTVKPDHVHSGDESHGISLETDESEICWVQSAMKSSVRRE